MGLQCHSVHCPTIRVRGNTFATLPNLRPTCDKPYASPTHIFFVFPAWWGAWPGKRFGA